ncbi:phage portal protein [Priestia megaterium]|uniref:phage portal protein n=1 Tax=Priestia megaterium TaxID=1404 RepID=UPI002E1F999A|nr:phage portal protein [Priestia megaterium]MED4267345.1 phage portal protein [Priestia megaterium]MED4278306.1 phage portal protein [Priestia megaterium]MED4314411.1 phage portal protein [Priestia megaterium]
MLFENVKNLVTRSVPEEQPMQITSFADDLLLGETNSPYHIINASKIRKIPTAEACLNLISGTIAQMPITLYKEREDGSVEKIKNDNRVKLLNEEPNENMTGYEMKVKAVQNYWLYGEAFIARYETMGGKGKWADELHVLPNHSVTEQLYHNRTMPWRAVSSDYIYTHVIKQNEKTTWGFGSTSQTVKEYKIKSYEMIHIKNGSDRGVLVKGKDIFNQAINEADYSNNVFSNGALPGGVLKYAKRLTKETKDKIASAWKSTYSGNSNAAKTVILDEDVDYKPLTWNPNDIQLSTSKKTTNSEICKLFNVPESMIDSNIAKHYGSMEQDNAYFLKYNLGPTITAIEEAINKVMLLEKEKRDGYYFRFDTSELQRATEKERVEALDIAVKAGLMSLDEARAKLDLEPLKNNYLKLDLGAVLYDMDTGEIKVPNMGLVKQQPKIDKPD